MASSGLLDAPHASRATEVDDGSAGAATSEEILSNQPGNWQWVQKVYLAEIAIEAFETIVSASAYESELLARGGDNSLTYEVVAEALDDAVQRGIETDAALDSTIKETVIQARRGQGTFRKNVEAR